jgi:hypothetical protein
MFADYVSYFKYLCEKHPDLLHAEQSGERVFEVISSEEAVGDFRAGAKGKSFIVRLILPGGTAGGDESNAYVDLRGGFVIARYHSDRKDGKSAQLDALAESYRIGTEFLARMMSDSNAGVPLFGFSAGTLEAMSPGVQPRLLVGDALYSGWIFTFRWSRSFVGCLGSPAAPEWTDGGVHPSVT